MTKIPMPGQPVRGSRSGAPVMALFDLLGRRWSMGVVWTLAEIGPATFRRLQEACESISPAVLNQRLKELQTAGLVHKTEDGYAVTELGTEIHIHLEPLGRVAKKWAANLTEDKGSKTGHAAGGTHDTHVDHP